MKKEYVLEGLNCASCGNKIEKAVKNLCEDSTFSFATKTLVVNYKKDLTKEIKKIVNGYEPDVKVLEKGEAYKEDSKVKSIIIFSLSVLIFISSYFINEDYQIWGFILSYFLAGYKVIIKAIKNIIKLRPLDENFLMFIATIGAFAIGEYSEAVAVMLFFYVGEFFQDLAVKKSRGEIKNLLDINPTYANLYKNGEMIRVLPSNVNVGDIIVVKAGEKVPVDGIVIEGTASLDVKSLTGEAKPYDVSVNEQVLSSSINLKGVIKVRATKEFKNSTVSKIIELVENSQQKKSKTENFITKFAKIYTPIVVISAILIATIPTLIYGMEVFNDNLYKGLVFLVVSCPCALVISVPLGFFGGIGNLSKKGILVKGSNYLEGLNNIEHIVFDKTGTLTKGTFEIKQIMANNISENELLEIAAYGESFSNHPIAKAILKEYNKEIIKEKISSYEELGGYGIKLKINSQTVYIGNEKLMDKEKIQFHKKEIFTTVLYIAKENEYLGCIELADVKKETAKETVDGLIKRGINNITMLTGDNKNISKEIGEELGIKNIISNLLPHEKASYMEEFTKKTLKNTVFVGDGINDAPALKIADIGISMGGVGSDVAIEASDIVLMKDDPKMIIEAIDVAKATRRIVTQNIILALGIKVIVMVLTLFGLSDMWEAVFADVGVSLIAILNSIRILKK